ncbi:putative aldehyde dehydrogenase YfmT [Streptomyces chartreusis NRRL 3882]|uniref:Putative aldehyde dehydrogenase YfmT n=1 Tax=Streptomyces chartreusis NRRL 3882 TaxID=1079985 RepID=A0A2N9BKG0_STRCX|nr:putative aldehyde dehydrogenase YfmT [Streptomyces chartreusis NRRL 3882]
MANDTDQGLTAGIITENGTHGLLVARRLRTGMVHINDQSVADDPQAPFGGFKSSGYGRFGGRWGIEAFRTPVGSLWPPSTPPTPSEGSAPGRPRGPAR